jgi:hypothetical protein
MLAFGSGVGFGLHLQPGQNRVWAVLAAQSEHR